MIKNCNACMDRDCRLDYSDLYLKVCSMLFRNFSRHAMFGSRFHLSARNSQCYSVLLHLIVNVTFLKLSETCDAAYEDFMLPSSKSALPCSIKPGSSRPSPSNRPHFPLKHTVLAQQ